MKTFITALALVLMGLVQVAAAKIVLTQKSEGMTIQVEQIVDGLDIPWGMAFLNRSELIFTEQIGTVKLLNLDTRKTTRLATVSQVHVSGQGGLMDVAVPPGYKAGDWIYFTYSKKQKGQGVTVLARAQREGNQLLHWEDVLITQSATGSGRHFGSRIAFDGKGHLFFSVGDRGHRPNGQDLSTHAGSILRVFPDGSVPSDNPFINTRHTLPEIWSYGHRNPQGIAYDEAGDRLWSIEHGPRGGDEINLIQRGKNYGWAVVSHGKEYWGPLRVGEGTAKKGTEQPVKVYIPSIAPGSLIYYSGQAFPKWRRNLIAGALKLAHLNRVVLNNSLQAVREERLLEDLGERIRALVQSPEGWIYFSTDSGRILRLKPSR